MDESPAPPPKDPSESPGFPGAAEPWLDWIGIAIVLLAIARVCAPMFRDLSTFGGHDWDEVTTHRYLAVKSLREFGQFPFWNPYACGGFSDWSNVQGGAVVVSPWFPIYWFFDLRLALRLEVLGCALLSAVGTWLWAGAFTRSAAARAFACLVFVVNGRWALQAASGHSWHLYYAWMPWAFYFFEQLLASPSERRRVLYALGSGGAVAMMVYNAGIYPLPHTVVLLGVYGGARALFARSFQPLVAGAAVGLTALGLSAPKLIPTLVDFADYPRLVDSLEFIDLNAFVQALVARGQTAASSPAQVSQWGWHEYGMYIGWPAFITLVLTTWHAKTDRERALRLAGVVALLLGFGHFHDASPWAFLHQLSLFRSQHVPSRWLYPAVLLLGVLAASVVERALRSIGGARRGLEAVLLAAMAALALDISLEASRPMEVAFWMEMPAIATAPQFHQEQLVPQALRYVRNDYAPPAVPAMTAGVGVIECALHAGLNVWAAKDAHGHTSGLGAVGRGDPMYRGEAYTLSNTGRARLVRFSPNEVTVELSGGHVGDRLILNQNFDPGWSVDGIPVEEHGDALSVPVTASHQTFHFKFRPRRLGIGILLFAWTVLAYLGLWNRPALQAWIRARQAPPRRARTWDKGR